MSARNSTLWFKCIPFIETRWPFGLALAKKTRHSVGGLDGGCSPKSRHLAASPGPPCATHANLFSCARGASTSPPTSTATCAPPNLFRRMAMSPPWHATTKAALTAVGTNRWFFTLINAFELPVVSAKSKLLTPLLLSVVVMFVCADSVWRFLVRVGMFSRNFVSEQWRSLYRSLRWRIGHWGLHQGLALDSLLSHSHRLLALDSLLDSFANLFVFVFADLAFTFFRTIFDSVAEGAPCCVRCVHSPSPRKRVCFESWHVVGAAFAHLLARRLRHSNPPACSTAARLEWSDEFMIRNIEVAWTEQHRGSNEVLALDVIGGTTRAQPTHASWLGVSFCGLLEPDVYNIQLVTLHASAMAAALGLTQVKHGGSAEPLSALCNE